jgi:hypothetical protein
MRRIRDRQPERLEVVGPQDLAGVGGIVHHRADLSVIVLVVHVIDVTPVVGERDTPVAIDIHGPLSPPTSFEGVQSKAGGVEVSQVSRRIEPRQDAAEFGEVIRMQAPCVAGLQVTLQTAMLESNDHR